MLKALQCRYLDNISIISAQIRGEGRAAPIPFQLSEAVTGTKIAVRNFQIGGSVRRSYLVADHLVLSGKARAGNQSRSLIPILRQKHIVFSPGGVVQATVIQRWIIVEI